MAQSREYWKDDYHETVHESTENGGKKPSPVVANCKVDGRYFDAKQHSYIDLLIEFQRGNITVTFTSDRSAKVD